jgi:hypothetical protein
MRRALIVVVAAMVTAFFSGIDDPSLAAEQQRAQTEGHRQVIADQARGLTAGTAVHIEFLNGTSLDGVIEQVNRDSIVATLNYGNLPETRTFAFADIRRIQSQDAYRRCMRNGRIAATAIVGGAVFASCAVCIKASAARKPGGEKPSFE